jgi:multidrug transporter EmrE-like cation transporter
LEKEQKKGMASPYIFLAGSVCLGVLGQFLMKNGMLQVGGLNGLSVASLVRIFTNLLVLAGFASYAVSSVAYLMALSKLDLSVAYPLVGVGQILILLISTFILREPVTAFRWFGAALIFAGVYLVSR